MENKTLEGFVPVVWKHKPKKDVAGRSATAKKKKVKQKRGKKNETETADI